MFFLCFYRSSVTTLSGLLHWYGPLARYANFRVAHALGMPGTFSPPPRVSDPYMHHGTCVTHVPGCMPGSLTSGFLWSRWRGKRSRHSRRMRNPQFYVSGKRPIAANYTITEVLVRPSRGQYSNELIVFLWSPIANVVTTRKKSTENWFQAFWHITCTYEV